MDGTQWMYGENSLHVPAVTQAGSFVSTCVSARTHTQNFLQALYSNLALSGAHFQHSLSFKGPYDQNSAGLSDSPSSSCCTDVPLSQDS